jgi:hypothetical protein
MALKRTEKHFFARLKTLFFRPGQYQNRAVAARGQGRSEASPVQRAALRARSHGCYA